MLITDKLNRTIIKDDKNAILDYGDYILNFMQFIVIETSHERKQVFSIFESINSKGKQLEVIDLIKTYIFSLLDEADYSNYLSIWGKLIVETEDHLYDYMYNFIKAYINFYKQNISLENFKITVKRDMQSYYSVTTEKEAVIKFLGDLYNNIKYYVMLKDYEAAIMLIPRAEFKFYYKVFVENGYEHPKPLFLRLLIERSNEKITSETVVGIVTEVVKFMIKFLTISGGDSKDVISMFSNIMTQAYIEKKINQDTVMAILINEYSHQNLTPESLKIKLKTMDAYKSKKLTYALLALYEAVENKNTQKHVYYDKAISLYQVSSEHINLDHLLVQIPDSANEYFKYYKNPIRQTLVLKEGHDFPGDIFNGMHYETFKQKTIHRIGNLKLSYRDKNSSKKANAITVEGYGIFCKYAQICARGEEIAETIIDDCIPAPTFNEKYKLKNTAMQEDKTQWKIGMKELINAGVVKPGDRLYIKIKECNQDDSIATLVDYKYVEYKGKKITINQWGCDVTGWKSMCIYSYVAIIGEQETLQIKREKLANSLKENNEV